VAVLANGTAETDWLLLPSGGTYSYGTLGGVLTGSNIGVQAVLGNGTSSNNGSLLGITGGVLNFTSGAFNGVLGSSWSWGGGGTLNLMGCIAGVTTPGACTPGTPTTALLSDDFQSVVITPAGLGFDVVLGQLQGTINSNVAAYFGLSSTEFSASSMNLMFTSSKVGQAFSGLNLGGTISAGSPVYVSEDWSVSSALGLFAFAVTVFGVACRLGLLRPVVF
jgi:hypothetical protein